MYQIDVSTAATTQPAATSLGAIGYFTDGNPATATPATLVPAEFLNATMLEILNAITAAGLTPTKSTYNQLATAITTLIGNNRAAMWTATDTGTANTYAATLSPVPAAYTSMVVVLQIVNANTGAATFNANGLGVKNIKKYSSGALAALAAGDLPASGIAILVYDGTQFILVNVAGGVSAVTAGNGTVTIGGTAGAPTVAVNLGNPNTWTGLQGFAVQTLTDAATVAWNASLGQVAKLTTSAARAIGAPTALAPGFYFLELISGGYTPSWNSIFKFPYGALPAALTGTCTFSFFYDGTYLHCFSFTIGQA